MLPPYTSAHRSVRSMSTATLTHSVRAEPETLLALHAAFPDRYPVLLESAAAGQPLGRFDILFAHPGARLTLHRTGALVGPESSSAGTFLSALDRWWRREQIPVGSALPFSGGWFLYLGYELAGQIEPRLQLAQPAAGPIAQAVRVPAAIIREHESGNTRIVVEAGHELLLESIAKDIAAVAGAPQVPALLLRGEIIEDPPERYVHAVERALEYIAAGDIYQANLSRGWTGRLMQGVQPHHVYQRLRRTNPGPFAGLAVLDDIAIVSSSPERLVQVHDGWASTRPIAGTRPRGKDEAADRSLVQELHAHPKERAEHVMLIDLERNDLGRVCEPGTVHVDEYMTIESYAHVHHIVSNVRGKLRADVTPGQVLAAVFPGGTITGCPKVRCMEIIAALEGTARGAYTGSFGYLNRDGSVDMNILIRSLEMHGQQLSLRAGAGIVADSIPIRELEEARAKARGVLRALSSESSP
jgi:anthranilate synthase component 1